MSYAVKLVGKLELYYAGECQNIEEVHRLKSELGITPSKGIVSWADEI